MQINRNANTLESTPRNDDRRKEKLSEESRRNYPNRRDGSDTIVRLTRRGNMERLTILFRRELDSREDDRRVGEQIANTHRSEEELETLPRS